MFYYFNNVINSFPYKASSNRYERFSEARFLMYQRTHTKRNLQVQPDRLPRFSILSISNVMIALSKYSGKISIGNTLSYSFDIIIARFPPLIRASITYSLPRPINHMSVRMACTVFVESRNCPTEQFMNVITFWNNSYLTVVCAKIVIH